MDKLLPLATIQALARGVYKEASTYGFGQLDIIRLINELMDCCNAHDQNGTKLHPEPNMPSELKNDASDLPLKSRRLVIRAFDRKTDTDLLAEWLPDKYGRFFVLSSTAARAESIDEILNEDRNHLGIITTLEGCPIGAMAYLDHDISQKRAELRKLIGVPEYRGQGLAEEATRLWIAYGSTAMDLEKKFT